jgi:hypothetical protein
MTDRVRLPWRYVPTIGFFRYALGMWLGQITGKNKHLWWQLLPCMRDYAHNRGNVRRPTWYERAVRAVEVTIIRRGLQ